METPAAFDRSISYSTPTHQRSIFGRAIAGCHLLFSGYSNLGINSSQRSESYHVPMREITCDLLSLAESAQKLTQTYLQRLQALELDEIQLE